MHSESIGMVFATILQWSLPEDLALVFERKYSDVDMPSLETCLEFLNTQIQHQENLNTHKLYQLGGTGSKDLPNNRSKGNDSHGKTFDSRKLPNTVDTLTVGANNNGNAKMSCIFCSRNNSHFSNQCSLIKNWSVDQKLARIRENRGCFRCLKKHTYAFSDCHARVVCQKCLPAKRFHNTILCRGNTGSTSTLSNSASTERVKAASLPVEASQDSRQSRQDNEVNSAENKQSSTHTAQEPTFTGQASVKLGLHQTQGSICLGESRSARVNIIWDTGSPLTFVEESLARSLDLKPIGRDPLELEGLGAQKFRRMKYNRYKLKLKSLKSGEVF